MNMLKMCWNPKVLVGLAAVAVATYLVAPNTILALLPVLAALICPLSMVAMMWGMRGVGGTPAVPQAVGAGQYVCPMHPDVRAAQPGRCPTCGMSLVPAPVPPAPQMAGTREEQLAALRAQLQLLGAQQAAIAQQIEQLDPRAEQPAVDEPRGVVGAGAGRSLR